MTSGIDIRVDRIYVEAARHPMRIIVFDELKILVRRDVSGPYPLHLLFASLSAGHVGFWRHLPAVAFALVAVTGDSYAGHWYAQPQPLGAELPPRCCFLK
jgi:hypothetical protein